MEAKNRSKQRYWRRFVDFSSQPSQWRCFQTSEFFLESRRLAPSQSALPARFALHWNPPSRLGDRSPWDVPRNSPLLAKQLSAQERISPVSRQCGKTCACSTVVIAVNHPRPRFISKTCTDTDANLRLCCPRFRMPFRCAIEHVVLAKTFRTYESIGAARTPVQMRRAGGQSSGCCRPIISNGRAFDLSIFR